MKLKLKILSIIFVFPLYLFSQQKNTNNDTLELITKEVVVTATKYQEAIMEVPLSVSILEGVTIEQSKGLGMDDVLNKIPGILVQSRFGNQDVRITVRGFGARGSGDRSNAGTSRGIKFFLDGIPETEPDGRTSFDNIDLALSDRIEIVRSNSSALWGNAAGGVISISSFPLLAGSYFKPGLLIGSYGFKKYYLQSGTDLGLGNINLAFSNTSQDGYRQHSSSERNILNIGLNSILSDRTILKVALIGTTNKFNIPGPLTQQQYDSLPEMANPNYLARKERRNNRLARIGTTINHKFNDNNELNGMAFTQIKFLQRSERNTFRDFTRYHIGANASWINRLDLSNDFKNTFLLGFDEQYQDGAIQFWSLKDGEREKLRTNKREGANTAGFFVQDEINYKENLSILLGARYDLITYYTRVYFDRSIDILTNNSEDKTYSKLTPKAGILYRLSPEHSIFANFGGGIEVPAGNETDPSGKLPADTAHQINPLLEPIVSTSFELGDKLRLNFENGFFRALSSDLSIFYIITNNELIPYASGAYYLSAGKTTKTGIEFALDLFFDYGLSLQTAITYSLNKYNEYLIDSLYAGFKADYSNNEIAGIPSVYYNAAIRWHLPFLKGLYTEFETRGVGSYYADDANMFQVPSFMIFNLKIGTSEQINLFDFVKIGGFLSINNLTNQKYVSSAFINPDIDNKTKLPMYLEPGLPMNLILGLNLLWN